LNGNNEDGWWYNNEEVVLSCLIFIMFGQCLRNLQTKKNVVNRKCFYKDFSMYIYKGKMGSLKKYMDKGIIVRVHGKCSDYRGQQHALLFFFFLKNMHHSYYLGANVTECQNIRHNFNNIIILQVRREANQVAHYLTKYVISISSDVVWIKEMPSSIDAVLWPLI